MTTRLPHRRHLPTALGPGAAPAHAAGTHSDARHTNVVPAQPPGAHAAGVSTFSGKRGDP